MRLYAAQTYPWPSKQLLKLNVLNNKKMITFGIKEAAPLPFAVWWSMKK